MLTIDAFLCRPLMASTSTLPFSFCAESSTTWPSFFNNTEPHQRYAIFFICVIYECPLPVKLGGGALGSIPSVSPFVCLSTRCPFHSVFGHFLSRPLIYSLEILYKNLSWYSTTSTFVAFDQIFAWVIAGSKISMSSTKFVFFRADRKIKMAALAPDWLRHFRLPLWNGWTEFNETWQAAWS